ncbi:3-phenylpropionate/cinnamic acid dioxygenase small subunit [Rhodococcus percolatus]|uniref:nuclear transport factor 2 family protein n=1 Tax=Rhodococcus opacus TaxID=37919 RepID=UPI0015F96E75|nr:nuclear transport factor 2 family protein [Rhodococcus opacus]MBA8963454.1 3-phenylpropionate/cinnamic acid dioxygenase small subunit [Rhodococcus opacus]MBP2206944.1 3-phenylpropionate/cinnamic acid dioxygenase small subunit [Rhodococcus opacus]
MPEPAPNRVRITDRLHVVAVLLDTKDWPGFAATLTEDVVAYGRTGRADVVARVRSHLDVCGATQHLLGNIRVDVDGDAARTRSYFRAFHVGLGDRAGATYECLGEYRDEWRRGPSGWLLAGRVIDVGAEVGDRGVIAPLS